MAEDQKPEERPEIYKENFERELRVILTGDEVATRADRLGHLIGERDHKAELMATAKKHAQNEVNEIEARIRRLGNEVRDKACYKEVPCERVFDYRTGTVTEVRSDTGEEIGARPMNEIERQMRLPKKPPKGDGPAAGGGAGGLDEEFEEPADEKPADDEKGGDE